MIEGSFTVLQSRAAAARRVWPHVLVWTALLGVHFLTGCLPDDCTVGATRCDGSMLERCTGHPGGVYGPVNDPQYVHGRSPDWEPVTACGADRCITPDSGASFCALETTPNAACAGPYQACDGQALVTCNDGYVIERRLCSSCDASQGICHQGTDDACASGSCGGPLQCNGDPSASCELPCTCPDGAECDACAASWSTAPDGGPSRHWTCQAGFCSDAY